MELKELVGLHKLTGVDMDSVSVNTWGSKFEDCQVINFILDGRTYTATEEPDDGYRSNMRDIVPSDYKVKNKFKPCKVLGKMREDNKYFTNEILDLIDVKTGKVVLSVGTENTDDYYPCWVAEFTPENMAINTGF
jgi:hypothetical protein